MFDFIRLQYQMGKLTAEQVQTFVPRWLSDKQATEIVTNLSE